MKLPLTNILFYGVAVFTLPSMAGIQNGLTSYYEFEGNFKNKAEAIGDIQFFHPAQKAFANVSPPVIERTQILLTGTCPIDSKALRLARRNWMESTPSTSFCSGISVKSSDSES